MAAPIFTPLKRVATSGGEVLRALRSDEDGFVPVEEAYFSRLDPGSIRAWKRHREMQMNVVVPVGHVRFVTRDDDGAYHEFDLGPDHDYGRLTVPPGTWVGFMGGHDGGLILNLASILHHPDEADALDADAFDYRWELPA